VVEEIGDENMKRKISLWVGKLFLKQNEKRKKSFGY